MAPSPALHNGDSAKDSSNPIILVVEDSITMRHRLVATLKNDFEVMQADEGEEAWACINKHHEIEMVLTDIDMPNWDGFELLKHIRNSDNQRIAQMQVIVVTGADNTKAKQQAFLEGANDFISKTADDVELLARVHAHHKLAQTIIELEKSKQILSEQALTDPLTKLTNRRHFFEKCDHEFNMMKRHKKNFSVMMIDIDHFKTINDRFGHPAGDYILVETGKILQENLRQGDELARIGGEEFAVAAPYTSRLGGVVLAERLRKAVQNNNFIYKSKQIPVTVSIGLASLKRDSGENIRDLLAIADQRLYNAKLSGRNRVGLSTDDPGNGTVLANEIKAASSYLGEVMRMMEQMDENAISNHIHELMEQIIPLQELINELMKSHLNVTAKNKSTAKPRQRRRGNTDDK